MQFPIHINISSKRAVYDFDINHKVTILTGYSGVGKSLMTSLINNEERMAKISISSPKYSFFVIGGSQWYEAHSNALLASEVKGSRYIFIFDDSDIVLSKSFVDLFLSDKWNIYIIINRFQKISEKSLSVLPFSTEALFSLKEQGKRHWIENKYNFTKSDDLYYDCVITEDSSNGYKFLKSFNNSISTSTGNSNITDLLSRNKNILHGKKVLVFADLASFGSLLEDFVRFCGSQSFSVSLVEDYQCFEYLLLRSNLLKELSEKEGVFNKSLEGIVSYKSLEMLYESELERITKGTNLELPHNKRSKMHCYIRNCCVYNDNSCKLSLYGNKQERIFYKTEWQKLFEVIRNSNLIRIK